MRSPVLCFASAVSLAVSVGTLAAHPPPGVAQQVPTTAFTAMKYRHISPLGNRITSVAGVPGDRFAYCAGAASGGLWKTEDGGVNWRPVFDDQPVHSVGEVEVAPSDPNVVWAGTGEPFIRSNVSIGNGVWKSTVYRTMDGGTTSTRLSGNGLPTGEIGKIALCMSRADSRRVYALIETGDGVPWEGSDTDGGELWRSDDGGHNWALISHDRDLAGRTAYYTRCEVNPDDPDEAYFLAAAYSTPLDGGVTSSAAPFLQGPVWDPRGAWHSVGGGGP